MAAIRFRRADPLGVFFYVFGATEKMKNNVFVEKMRTGSVILLRVRERLCVSVLGVTAINISYSLRPSRRVPSSCPVGGIAPCRAQRNIVFICMYRYICL